MIEFHGGRRVPSTLVDAFEATFDVVLPDSFREVVLEHDGAGIEPGTLPSLPDAEGRREVVSLSELYAFMPRDGSWDIVRLNHEVRDAYPGLIAFGRDGGGRLIAFDYRSRRDDPPVVLMDRDLQGEVRIVRVAERFADVFPSMIDEEAAEILHQRLKMLS